MKKLISLLVCLCMVFTVSASLAEATLITVKGSATIYADPDICSLSAGVTCQGSTVTEVQQQLSGVISTVTEALLEIGLQKEDITTSNYSCYPTYDYSGDTPTLQGYTASHTLSVSCKDITMLDAVITAVSNGGATEIYAIDFDVADKSALYAEALTNAVSSAKEKATILAAAMGMSVSSTVSVTENSVGSVGYTYKTMSSGLETNDTITTGISSGSVSVTASVEIVYAAE